MSEQNQPEKEETLNAPNEHEIQEEKEMMENGQETPENEAPSTENSWEAEKSALQDKYLRLVAEFDNFKRRNARERMDLMQSAGQEIMVAVLPVLDDLERAVKNMSAEDPSKEGIDLIRQKMFHILSQKGLKPIETTGKDFDTDLHEAITHIPSPDESQKGKVLDEVEKGYLLGEKVIRFAKVVVGG